MEIRPYLDRLVAGVKNAIVEIITIAVGFFIADVVASHWHTRYSAYWSLTLLVVWIASMVVVRLLLQYAWSRYRRSPN
jgi:DMSO/TMAO reductase YedYZ heme-binding membrane subunit